MPRYIDADALMASAIKVTGNNEFAFDNCYPYWQFSKCIKDAPTVDVVLVVYGEWTGNWVSTDEDLDGYFDGYKCIECDEQNEARTRYCPNCGARMDALPEKE